MDVIDIDAGGDETRAEELLARVGEVLGLPEGWRTRTVATGRGLVANQALDIDMLRELSRGNF